MQMDSKTVGLIAQVLISEGHSTPDPSCPNNPSVCSIGTGSKLVFHSYYNFNSGVKKLASTTKYVHDQMENTRKNMSQNAFSYNQSYLQLIETKESASGTEEVVTKYRYPQSYSSSNSSIDKLQAQHILSAAIEKYVIRQNNNGSNARIISGQLTTYRLFADHVVPDKVWLFENNAGVNIGNFTLSTANSAGFSFDLRYKPFATFTSYDLAGNLTELSKENNYSTCYIFGYNNSFPIAEIKNASLTEVNNAINASPSISFKDSNHHTLGDSMLQDRFDILRSRLPNAFITSYSYKPLHGITSLADPEGTRSFYEYDDLQRLKIIRDMDQNILRQYTYNYIKH
jgi:hypothetical protein